MHLEQSGFRQDWISDTFWLISFGASVTAIGAGGLANYLVAKQSLGIAAPSFAAAVAAVLSAFSIFLFWEENPLPTHAKLLGTIRSSFLICYGKQQAQSATKGMLFGFVLWFSKNDIPAVCTLDREKSAFPWMCSYLP